MSSSLIVDDDRSMRGAPVGEPEPHLPFDSRAVEAPHVMVGSLPIGGSAYQQIWRARQGSNLRPVSPLRISRTCVFVTLGATPEAGVEPA